VSAAEEPVRERGRCRDCGRVANGRLVAHIDQGNGPGCTLVVCDPCAADPPKTPKAEQPRTYC
jgi:hypothetical protein